MAQPGGEAGVDERALARPGRADNGDEALPSHRVMERVDHAGATEVAAGVGLGEWSQTHIRVDPGRCCADQLAGGQSTRRLAGVGAGLERGDDTLRPSNRCPPGKDELGHRLEARRWIGGLGEHGIDRVGHASHPTGEGRQPAPLTAVAVLPSRDPRVGGSSGEEFPQQRSKALDVRLHRSRLIDTRLVVRDGDPEVGEIAAAGFVEQHVRRANVAVGDTGGVRCQESPTDLLDQLADMRQRPPAACHERRAGAALEKSEHQICATRLAPVVVERDDVRVLDAGNQLGLDLESPNELLGVGQLGTDHLDRHPPVGTWLCCHIHPAKPALTNRVVDHVSPQRPPCRRRP